MFGFFKIRVAARYFQHQEKEVKPMSDHERLTMTIPEFASAMGISAYLAYSLAAEDKLPVPVIRLGENRMVVSRRAVLALLEAKDENIEVEVTYN